MHRYKFIFVFIMLMVVVNVVGCNSDNKQPESKVTVSSSVNEEVNSSEEDTQSKESVEESSDESVDVKEGTKNGNVVRVEDNPNISEVEENQYFVGAKDAINSFLEDLVKGKYDDALNKCVQKSTGYYTVENLIDSENMYLENFAEDITGFNIDKNKYDKEIKKNKSDIKNNVYLKKLCNAYYSEYRFNAPVIFDIIEKNRRELVYKIQLDSLDVSENPLIPEMDEVKHNIGTFEDLTQADFFKDYYKNNKKKIDEIYDKYNSTVVGEGKVLVYFFENNGKAFCDNAIKKLLNNLNYSTINMEITLRKEIKKEKSSWLVDYISINSDNEEYLDEYTDEGEGEGYDADEYLDENDTENYDGGEYEENNVVD